jgi:hypothetical protein
VNFERFALMLANAKAGQIILQHHFKLPWGCQANYSTPQLH